MVLVSGQALGIKHLTYSVSFPDFLVLNIKACNSVKPSEPSKEPVLFPLVIYSCIFVVLRIELMQARQIFYHREASPAPYHLSQGVHSRPCSCVGPREQRIEISTLPG